MSGVIHLSSCYQLRNNTPTIVMEIISYYSNETFQGKYTARAMPYGACGEEFTCICQILPIKCSTYKEVLMLNSAMELYTAVHMITDQ